MNLKEPFISVITVVRNREMSVEACIKSVLEQTYSSFEYIIKDGNSTDQTVSIIRKYEKDLAYFETTADKSLYDAMNIATQKARGEWVCYINSDDRFMSSQVLAEVAPFLQQSTADISYDKAIIDITQGVHKQLPHNPIETIWKKMPLCHQAVFIRTSVAKQHQYSLSYSSAADYELFYRLWKLGYQFERIPVIVAHLSAGGLSDKQRLRGLKEVGQIKRLYDSNRFHHLLHSLHILKSAINLKVKAVLPKQIVHHLLLLRAKTQKI